jgi:biotin carboxyl carrier protein
VSETIVTPVESFAASEYTAIAERIVVAPEAGRFVTLPAEVFTTEGEWVEPGQVLAQIHQGENVVEVRSSWRGWMMGMLALDGAPVRAGEALFWIWSS